MELETLIRVIIESLEEVQRACEPDDSSIIKPETIPLIDLNNFDSLRACLYLTILEQKLNIDKFPTDDSHLCSKNKSLTVAESAKILNEMFNADLLGACNG